MSSLVLLISCVLAASDDWIQELRELVPFGGMQLERSRFSKVTKSPRMALEKSTSRSGGWPVDFL
jgi:hypothetical protein